MVKDAEDKKKKVVLVADDEANLLLLLKDNLEEQGFSVLTAENGEEALSKCIQEKPDIVILDVEMPKMNGWKVCENIRNKRELNYVPVILILSAYAQPEDIQKGLALGANKYITKPFKMKELVESVLKMLAS